MRFVKMTGNFAAVMQQIGQSVTLPFFETANDHSYYVGTHLERLRYFSVLNGTSHIQEKLISTRRLVNQKNFTTTFPVATEEQFKLVGNQAVPFARLGVAYLKEDQLAENPAWLCLDVFAKNNRKSNTSKLISLLIIHNFGQVLGEESVTLLIHPLLLSGSQHEEDKYVEAQTFLHELNCFIQCQPLSTLLGTIFDNRGVSLTGVNALQQRLSPNQNIDNRDYKKSLLEELCVRSLATDETTPGLKDYIATIQEEADTNIDYFKDNDFIEKIDTVFFRIRSCLQKSKKDSSAVELIWRAICYELLALQHPQNLKEQINLQSRAATLRNLAEREEEYRHFMVSLEQFKAVCEKLTPIPTEQIERNFYTQKYQLLQLATQLTSVKAQGFTFQEWSELFHWFAIVVAQPENQFYWIKLLSVAEQIESERLRSTVKAVLHQAELEKCRHNFSKFREDCFKKSQIRDDQREGVFQIFVERLLTTSKDILENELKLKSLEELGELDRVLKYCRDSLVWQKLKPSTITKLKQIAKEWDQTQVGELIQQVLHLFHYRRFLFLQQAYADKLLPRIPTPEGDLYSQFHIQGEEVLRQIQLITGPDPCTLKTEELEQLADILTLCTETVDKASAHSLDKLQLARLGQLSLTISGKEAPFWKGLGAALMLFAGIALVIGGVLATIPTGGSSLFFVVTKALGLTLLKSFGLVSLSGLSGLLFFQHNREKGLAKAVGELQKTLEANQAEFAMD